MKKVLIVHPIPGSAEDTLRNAGYEVKVGKTPILSKKSLISLIKKEKPDALLSLLIDPIDKDVIDAFSGKIIANYAVGFNNIDVAYATRKGIAVTNTPINGYSVAEFTASLTAALARRIAEAHDFTRTGKYKGWDPNLFIGQSLKGKKFGIVGTGHIGSEAARIMHKGFGMDVVYFDVVRNEKLEKECGAVFMANVDDVFCKADVVSLHVPLMKTTHHLADDRRLALMKPTALLINTARGPVVDEKALEQALISKKIAGAALDVFEFEPKISAKLRKLPNVILAPHIASATVEAREDMSRMAAENVMAVLEGKKPISPALANN